MAMAISFGICLYRHVIATDGPLVRSRIHCNAARTSRDGDPCKFLEIRHSGVTRITEQRHFIEIDTSEPFSRSPASVEHRPSTQRRPSCAPRSLEVVQTSPFGAICPLTAGQLDADDPVPIGRHASVA